ncbi:hypothetical protein [Pyrococcus horikoshii]|uniref:Uncharacterized protein n=1 Tax=Pyrococcus horikoshii TaxID=53953 RepID=A0A832T061_PYRHR|nr:hypothetical protein [Pyrococcus horikoshii]HII60265.1 hypothetical protein [Pyrococcus horikoshii]
MELDLLLKRLDIVRRRREALLLEEARLARMIRQKRIKNVSLLRVIRREKELVTREEAKIVRFIKQAGA